ncbi:MAG: hypothetical protein ACKO0Z_15075 [Betaproteobacteria bacterium]
MAADPTAFAGEIIDLAFEYDEDDTITFEELLEIAAKHGLVISRKPTADEIADPEWWGHTYGITADDETVTERSPDFAALLPEMEAA